MVEGDFATFAGLGDPSLNGPGQAAFVVSPAFGDPVPVAGASPTGDR